MSAARRFDGIWIGSLGGAEEENLARVEGALLLIHQHSRLDHARIVRELERIWVRLSLYGNPGEYEHALKACILDTRYVADPATTIERIASAIVHETTHARLERYGIEYKAELRTRIEAICFRRELAFAVCLPNSAELQKHIAQCLEWSQANPDFFSDTNFRERHTAGEIEALRHAGTPDLVIRATLALKGMLDRARRLFRIARY